MPKVPRMGDEGESSAQRLHFREQLRTKLCVLYFARGRVASFKNFFYHSAVAPLALVAGFFFPPSPGIYSSFPLRGAVICFQKTGRKQEDILLGGRFANQNCLCLLERVSSKGLLLGWKRRRSGCTCTHTHTLTHTHAGTGSPAP